MLDFNMKNKDAYGVYVHNVLKYIYKQFMPTYTMTGWSCNLIQIEKPLAII